MELQEIKQYWEEVGKVFKNRTGISPTSRDPYLAYLERKNITSFLKPEMNILEIGCGDAVHTIEYAPKVKSIIGLDISRSLLSLAKTNIKKSGLKNINLIQGSILELEKIFKNQKFDAIISQRCLINLPDWNLQKNSIEQIAKILNSKGLFLMTEGFNNGLNEINKIRLKNNLPEIKVVKYNHNFDDDKFNDFIVQTFQIEQIFDYGFYLYMSRVYHPMVVFPESPKHHSKLNETASILATERQFPDFKKYSYNLFYVLKKI